MKCPNCGTENKNGVKFCKGCGASLQNSSVPTNSASGTNNNTLIICVALVLCVIVIGAVVLLSNGSDDSGSSVAVDESSSVSSVDDSDDADNHDSSDYDSGMSYSDAADYFPEASDTVLSHVFDEADSNGDGVLSDSEFTTFEKVRDHTKKYANNIRNSISTEKPSSGEKTGYCADHGRVAVVNGDECPYCIDLGFSDTKTKTSSW